MSLTAKQQKSLQAIDERIVDTKAAMAQSQKLLVDMATDAATTAIYPVEIMKRLAATDPNSALGQRTASALQSIDIWMTEYKALMARVQSQENTEQQEAEVPEA